MSKITLNNLANLNNATTVTTAINSNNQTLIDAVDNTLSRDGTSPNTMSSVIDMNSNKIINVGGPTGSQDAVRLIDIQNINADAAALAVAVGTAQAFSTSASSSATSASSSATSASTFATAAGSSATAAAISATSASSSLATLLASGIWNNSLQNVISTSYAVANSDFTKTIVCNGGTSGLTLTFGSASGYSSSHVNFVQNNSTSRAVKVSIDSYAGWNGTNHIYLWPQCGGFVFKANGTWCHT